MGEGKRTIDFHCGPDASGPHTAYLPEADKAILARPDENFVYSVENEAPIKPAS